MKLVVGLGNPGSKYDGTRHNVGFLTVAELAVRWHASKPRRRFDADIAEATFGDEKVLLACPQTYMNESGRAVRQIVDFHRVPVDDLLVLCDDFNLELARLRMRPNGSAGGQKGLADIIRHLGTEDFPRLRIGIGKPPERMDAADFVLSRFRKGELPSIEAAIVRAAEGTECWVRKGLAIAMNETNSPESSREKP